MPTIIEYYLGEKPLLANVDTYRCWLDDERSEVLDRVDELVIKPVEGSGGYGIVFGPDASDKELAAMGERLYQAARLSLTRRLDVFTTGAGQPPASKQLNGRQSLV